MMPRVVNVLQRNANAFGVDSRLGQVQVDTRVEVPLNQTNFLSRDSTLGWLWTHGRLMDLRIRS